MMFPFVDIHCHILPAIDDGPRHWDESLAMARLAVADGTATMIATPHQLGILGGNRAAAIRSRVAELQARLDAAHIPLQVLPGADVRIDADLAARATTEDVLTLGDHGRHVLLQLPHDVHWSIEPLLDFLRREQLVGVLSHPERNHSMLRRPELLTRLVDAGCLIEIAAASLCGSVHVECQHCAAWLLAEGLVHLVASDGHGAWSRRPLLRRAFDRVATLTDADTAADLFCHNPRHVARGEHVAGGRRAATSRSAAHWARGSAA